MPFPLESARFDATELKLGRRLPTNYRNRMVRANGGCVEAAKLVADISGKKDEVVARAVVRDRDSIRWEVEPRAGLGRFTNEIV